MSPGYEDGREKEKERERGGEWRRWKGDAVGPTERGQRDLRGRGSFSHIDHTTLPRYTELRRWKHLSPPGRPRRRSSSKLPPAVLSSAASYRSRNILISRPLFLYIYQRGAKWVVKHEGFYPGATLKRKGINGGSDLQIELMIKERNGLRHGNRRGGPGNAV